MNRVKNVDVLGLLLMLAFTGVFIVAGDLAGQERARLEVHERGDVDVAFEVLHIRLRGK